MKIKRLEILAPNPADLCGFYHQNLGLALAEGDECALQCGDSILVFVAGEYDGVYHFAFNIPADEIRMAAKWLQEKGLQLIPYDGNEIVPFKSWEAEAIYFHDPAGNIVEFIGRRRLQYPSAAAFSASSIRSISEMGFASEKIEQQFSQLTNELSIPVFGNRSDHFAAIGDDEGLFILVDAKHKKWIPLMEDANALPFKIEIEVQEKSRSLAFQNGELKFKAV